MAFHRKYRIFKKCQSLGRSVTGIIPSFFIVWLIKGVKKQTIDIFLHYFYIFKYYSIKFDISYHQQPEAITPLQFNLHSAASSAWSWIYTLSSSILWVRVSSCQPSHLYDDYPWHGTRLPAAGSQPGESGEVWGRNPVPVTGREGVTSGRILYGHRA